MNAVGKERRPPMRRIAQGIGEERCRSAVPAIEPDTIEPSEHDIGRLHDHASATPRPAVRGERIGDRNRRPSGQGDSHEAPIGKETERPAIG